MLKKLFTLGMATVMALGTTMSAFAAEPVDPRDPLAGKVLVSEERVPVEDEKGNVFYVVVSEYVDEHAVKSEGVATRGIFPEYEVGTTKTFTVKIENKDITGLQAGVALSKEMLKTISKVAAEQIAKKIGTAWIPGLNAATTILLAIQVGSYIAGKTGVKVIVDLEYSSVYMHKEGHDMYGWDITDATLKTY